MLSLLSQPRFVVASGAVSLLLLIGVGTTLLAAVWPATPEPEAEASLAEAPLRPEANPVPETLRGATKEDLAQHYPSTAVALSEPGQEPEANTLPAPLDVQNPQVVSLQTLFETVRVSFAPQRAAVGAEMLPYLQRIVEVANAGSGSYHVEIVETDGDLARQRAQELHEALIRNGLIPGRIFVTGMSGTPGIGVFATS